MIFYLTIMSAAFAAVGATPIPLSPPSSPLATSLTEFGTPAVDFTSLFVKMVVAMVLVIALAIGIIRYVIPKLSMVRSRGGGKATMRVLDRMPLDARKALYIIEVENRRLLLGVSEHQVGLLAELKGEGEDDVLS